MKLLFREKMIAMLGLLVLFSYGISYMLLKDKRGIPTFLRRHYVTRNSTISYGINKPGPDFFTRQHGQYWVLYNYIKAAREFTGNESVTLILHGSDWSTAFNLAENLESWHGPISLTIFTNDNDFDSIVSALVYFSKCTHISSAFADFVSVNIIIHEDFLPKHIAWKDLDTIFSNFNCSEMNDFSWTEHQTHKVTVPINLIRNVGRLTARTHFVLLLDADIIPSFGIPQLFLKMIKAKNSADHPQKTIYVLPYFDIKFGSFAPKRKLDLENLDVDFLELYLNSMSLHKIPRLREWLKTNIKPVTEIFHETKHWGRRLAYYISSNDIEPFYDESSDRGTEVDRIDHLNLLEALDYNFYVVKLGFLSHYILPPYKFYTKLPPLNDTETQINLQTLGDFLKNFM